MFGEKGAQTNSETVWQHGDTERVDIENANPGVRPGNLHYHDADNVKYYYDPVKRIFLTNDLKTTTQSEALTKRLSTDPVLRNAVNKGLKFLGEQGQ
jgi:hypothetical protein